MDLFKITTIASIIALVFATIQVLYFVVKTRNQTKK